jgi:acetyl esterase/lipase
MISDSSAPALRVPPRDVPVPTTVSEQARALLGQGVMLPPVEWPPPDDHDAWRAVIAKQDAMVPADAPEMMVMSLTGAVAAGHTAEITARDVGGVPVHVATPHGTGPHDRRVFVSLHGGAFIQGGGDLCRLGAGAMAESIGATVWAVDYRMPPDHPFPAAVDDCLAVYRALLAEREPGEIVVGGLSAGANLAMATLLRARDEGLPLPACAVVNSPPADATGSGDTMRTNDGIDTLLVGPFEPVLLHYAGSHDLRDPYLSPLFGDYTPGFVPTMLISGTRDRLLSDTVRLHRKLRAAGVPAELHVFEAAPHGMFLGIAPEDHERVREIRRFVNEHWTASVPGSSATPACTNTSTPTTR